MELLTAIAMLCQTKGALSGLISTDAYQLQCQKSYLNCYLGLASKHLMKSKEFEISATIEKKYLYKCVLERRTPDAVETPVDGFPFSN